MLSTALSQNESPWILSRLGSPPEWSRLDPYQGTITRQEFQDELSRNYAAEPETIGKFVEILEDRARIRMATKRPDEIYELKFAESPVQPTARNWRPVDQLGPLTNEERPLEGMRIVIDPGHIGGEWAKMEERWFTMQPPTPPTPPPGTPPPAKPAPVPIPPEPVMEGAIVLRVAELLEANLTQLGARVALVRRELKPVTPTQPKDYVDYARQLLGASPDADPAADVTLRKESERLFYLSAEIRARGKKVNDFFKPDLTLCLHVNAEGWGGDPNNPTFVPKNHLHILINGCYSTAEAGEDDTRLEMLLRLVQRMHSYELGLASTVGTLMGEKTGLEPYAYVRNNAKKVSANPYVWSRNLLASRIYDCPVIYFEPHVMNNQLTYDRVQAGEYSGTRDFGGQPRINIFQEYADSVSEGLSAYYLKNRARPQPES